MFGIIAGQENHFVTALSMILDEFGGLSMRLMTIDINGFFLDY
jgi:hypothetical protein